MKMIRVFDRNIQLSYMVQTIVDSQVFASFAKAFVVCFLILRTGNPTINYYKDVISSRIVSPIHVAINSLTSKTSEIPIIYIDQVASLPSIDSIFPHIKADAKKNRKQFQELRRKRLVKMRKKNASIVMFVNHIDKANTAVDQKSFYSFDVVPFGRVDVSRIQYMSKGEFENIIIDSLPQLFRVNARKYVKDTIKIAMKYQIDPFWVFALMWTESHFNYYARSRVNATGLMQIMPGTGHYLAHKMDLPIDYDVIVDVIRVPKINIEMGIYYMRSLMKQFDNSYRLATVAYNLGPGNVRKRLRRGLETGVRNVYLKKVRRAYKFITSEYINFVANSKIPVIDGADVKVVSL